MVYLKPVKKGLDKAKKFDLCFMFIGICHLIVEIFPILLVYTSFCEIPKSFGVLFERWVCSGACLRLTKFNKFFELCALKNNWFYRSFFHFKP